VEVVCVGNRLLKTTHVVGKRFGGKHETSPHLTVFALWWTGPYSYAPLTYR